MSRNFLSPGVSFWAAVRHVVPWLLAAAAISSAPAAQPASDRVQAFLDGVKALQADFQQTQFDEHHKLVQQASGTLAVKRPGRFRWDYRKPYVQLIVSDGKKVWFYDSDLEQVTVKPLDKAVGNSPAVLLSGEQPVQASFQVTELGSHDGLDWVELRPKSEESSFVRAKLGFAGKSLQVMELMDSFGQMTRVEFSHMRRNPPLDDSLFNFVPPPNVDVIGDEG